MARVVPFRGLLYSASKVPDLKPVVAPPYDVISAEKAEEYRARDPHNIVHVDLPAGEGARYARAAELLASWRQSGVLTRDESPALYVCSERYALKGRPEKVRWGFIALVRIEEDDAGIVLPHEKTMDVPRLDRLELAAATRMQLSPIFLLYSDPAGEMSGPIEAVAHRPADRWVSDDSGTDVRLWRVADPEAVRVVCEGLESRKVWIADGHHRYAAARELRNRLRATEGGGAPGSRSYDHVMAYLTNVDAPGLSILPYHRVVKGSRKLAADPLARKLSAHFDLKRFSFEGFHHRAEQIQRRLHEVSDRGRLAFGLYLGGAEFILLLLKQDDQTSKLFSHLPEPLKGLDVSILQHGILEPILGITPDAASEGGILLYSEDIERAINWVDAGEAQAAFLLNPTRKQQLMAVAEAGLQMPPKSTYFYPKVLTGLVLNSLDPADEVCSPTGRAEAGRPTEG